MRAVDPFALPPAQLHGTAKGVSNTEQVQISPRHRFGIIRQGGYVATPIPGGLDGFTIGSIMVRDDRKARKRHSIPEDREIPPDQRFHNVYPTIFAAARGQSRGPVSYDAVEIPTLIDAEAAVGDLYSRHLVIDPRDPIQAEAWRRAAMTAASILGMEVEDARKLAARDALLRASDVQDRSGRMNMERMSLVVQMVERLLRERRDDITVKRWRMSQNLVSIARLLDALLKHVEIVNRVAFQAFQSDPLTGNPGDPVRQDNAVRFWRDHATKLTHAHVRPFGEWFFAMNVILQRAATAMDDGNIDEVRRQMIALQGVCAVAKIRAEVERILVPVAEMREINKRASAEDGVPWRAFSEGWANQESARVFRVVREELAPKARPLSRTGSLDDALSALNHATAYLHLGGRLEDAYLKLKEAAGLLERRIRP